VTTSSLSISSLDSGTNNPNPIGDRLRDDDKAISVILFAQKLEEAEPEVPIVWIKRQTRLIKASLMSESRWE